MTVSYTTYFGLVAVKNETPSAQDWAATYGNWITADKILYEAAVNHKHNDANALANPTGSLSLSTSDSGGTLLAGVTYYICVTYLDQYDRETAKSEYGIITTPNPIAAPATPTYIPAYDLVAAANALTGGGYWYKIAYKKGGGETLCSDPVYVQIPTNQTYSATIHFTSLSAAANGADTIVIYRKIGLTGSWNKLIDVTATDRDYYTDSNIAVPNCDIGPNIVNTTNAFNTITIDWSSLDHFNASKIRIYATTVTDGAATPVPVWVTETNQLVYTTTVQATPPTSYIWTGTTRSVGKPPVTSQCFPSPSKIELATEVEGNLPWANLPADFVWLQPVANYAALGTGTTDGEVKLALDSMTLYGWDGGSSVWTPISGGGITRVVIPLAEADQPMTNYLPTTALQDGDLCFVSTEASEGQNYGYRSGLFQYHENWAAPGWIKLNTIPVIPWEYYDNNYNAYHYQIDTGSLSLLQTEWGSYELLLFEGQNFFGREFPIYYDELGYAMGYITENYYLGQQLEGLATNDAFDYWSNTGNLAKTILDNRLHIYQGYAVGWEAMPTFTFRGSGTTPPQVCLEDDVYMESGKVKRALTQQTRNLLTSQDQAGLFVTFPTGNLPLGWSSIANGTATFSYAFSSYYGGPTTKGHIQINPGDTAGDGIVMDKDFAIPVTAGTQYVFSFLARCPSPALGWVAKIEWLTAAKATISTTTGSAFDSDSQAKKSVTGTAPANSAYAICHIVTAVPNAWSTANFSEFQFEVGNVPTDWVNPSLEWTTEGFSKYRGTFNDSSELPATAEENDIAYVLLDDSATPCESWYVYNSGWELAGVRKTNAYVASISTDMSGDANDNELKGKLNEVITKLRDAGLIE